MKSTKLTRHSVLGGASAADLTAILGKRVQAAAEFDFKLRANTPETHPLSIRLAEAAREIGSLSSDRLTVTVFPNSQLGGDPEMLSRLSSGGIAVHAFLEA